jgi:hypothetical protein
MNADTVVVSVAFLSGVLSGLLISMLLFAFACRRVKAGHGKPSRPTPLRGDSCEAPAFYRPAPERKAVQP